MDKNATKKTKNPFVYGIANDQCVWSRTGVIKPMKCINAFDCLDCSFDRKLQSNFEAKQAPGREDEKSHITPKMQMLSGQLKCRHMLSGRVDYKMCAHNYNCVKCPYDKMIEDTGYMPGIEEPVFDQASGFNVPRDHYFHSEQIYDKRYKDGFIDKLAGKNGWVVALTSINNILIKVDHEKKHLFMYLSHFDPCNSFCRAVQ